MCVLFVVFLRGEEGKGGRGGQVRKGIGWGM